MKRPISVTIISILLVLVGFIGLVTNSLAISVGMGIKSTIFEGTPEFINILLAYLGGLLLITGGGLIFRGQNLGRFIVLGWCMVALLLFADYIIPRIVYLGFTSLMLFNKAANKYFMPQEVNNSKSL
ncbi:hypothetical protein XYCOK13_35680 [Xylanibacillus composti]|uniref:Uncharacterized protein n=1 Tax=Xylanibacillus composti TaxID=1572762 RepID=A0A8J4M3E7_9BACL|nr:hypothetical protein [Xylanibacillus composti]GIQ70744.1 hypothetical protein XYCOK13_35680 [Xylanibacillus composti]